MFGTGWGRGRSGILKPNIGSSAYSSGLSIFHESPKPLTFNHIFTYTRPQNIPTPFFH